MSYELSYRNNETEQRFRKSFISELETSIDYHPNGSSHSPYELIEGITSSHEFFLEQNNLPFTYPVADFEDWESTVPMLKSTGDLLKEAYLSYLTLYVDLGDIGQFGSEDAYKSGISHVVEVITDILLSRYGENSTSDIRTMCQKAGVQYLQWFFNRFEFKDYDLRLIGQSFESSLEDLGDRRANFKNILLECEQDREFFIKGIESPQIKVSKPIQSLFRIIDHISHYIINFNHTETELLPYLLLNRQIDLIENFEDFDTSRSEIELLIDSIHGCFAEFLSEAVAQPGTGLLNFVDIESVLRKTTRLVANRIHNQLSINNPDLIEKPISAKEVSSALLLVDRVLKLKIGNERYRDFASVVRGESHSSQQIVGDVMRSLDKIDSDVKS